MELFIFARFHAALGNEAAVYEAVQAGLGPTRIEPGCLSIQAFRSVRDARDFYIQSRWQDSAALKRHVNMPHTVRFRECIAPLIDSPFKVALTEQFE